MSMKLSAPIVILCCLMSGCASYDGRYTPDCMARAGNDIQLDGGRFVWDRFTDQVLVNDAGEVVDQYPEYPMRGRYNVEGETIRFESYTGEPLPDMHLHREGTRTFLLTAEQLEKLQSTGELPRCPLVQGGYPEPD